MIGSAGLLLLAGLIFTKIGASFSLRKEPLVKSTKPVFARRSAVADPLAVNVSAPVVPAIHPSTREETLDKAFQEALDKSHVERNPEKSRVLMNILKDKVMMSGSKEKSVAAIVRFLDSGQDGSTALAFRVGPGHALAEAPTLRTALLDWLGQLDPAAAAEYSERVFEAMSSPEEYALALRNFAQGRPNQRADLRNYFDRMRTHLPWASEPGAGYLEAFDVAPYLADPVFIEPLASQLSSSSPASLRHASFMALDRLALANLPGVLTEMIDAGALNDQPRERASFVARADIRDPGQLQAVERYLSSSALSESELDYFVTLFPNANRFVSHNLLTDSGGQSLSDVAALDSAALERVRSWQTDPRFQRWRPQLDRLAERLQRFVQSATRGGHLPRKELGQRVRKQE